MRYSSVYLTLTAATLTLAAPKYEIKSESTSEYPVVPQYSPYPKSKEYEATGYSRHGRPGKPSGTGPRYYTAQVTTTSCAIGTGTAIGGTASGYPGPSSGGGEIFPIPSYTNNEPSGSSIVVDSTYEPTSYVPTTYGPTLPSSIEEGTYLPSAPVTYDQSGYQPSLPTGSPEGPSCPEAPTVTVTAYVTLTQGVDGGYVPATSLAGENGGYIGSTGTGYEGYVPGPSTTKGYGGTEQTSVPDALYPGTYDVSSFYTATSDYGEIPTSSYIDIPTETPSKPTSYVPGGGYTWDVPGSNGGGYGGSTGFATGTGYMTGGTTCTKGQTGYPTGTGAVGTGYTYSHSSSHTYSASYPIGTGKHSIVIPTGTGYIPTTPDHSTTDDTYSTSTSTSEGYKITLTPIVDNTATEINEGYTKNTHIVENYSKASPPIERYSVPKPKNEHVSVPTAVIDSTLDGGYLGGHSTSTSSHTTSHSTTESAGYPKQTPPQQY